ncbi:MAG TPA: hypothetical protein VGO40_06790 [Longimicrobium sp.]|jgi:hypothetical protein|nr:hypothetical protein [Longimicrobium sp.]
MRSARHVFVLLLVGTRAGAVHAQATVPDASMAVPLAPVLASAARRAVRTLAAGDTVRIVSGAGRYAGTISRITPDTVVVGASGRLDAIPRGEVTELERFRGKSSRGRAILIGAGAGLVSGGALGAVGGRLAGRIRCLPADQPCTPGEHDQTIQGALLAEGAILGALVGAMLGPTFRREHWDHAEGAFPLEAGPAPTGGIAAAVTLHF